ncbi:MAG: hypothetical protein E3J90_04905 [Promethearchaeota archaeon]|nr:MAG: hypothetical protein E3J90_04905 [Candidatus Lokiarchaeota archaeon]
MKLNEKQKDTIIKIFIIGAIQLLCFILYLVISAISGDFTWTVERLTSSLTGTFIQILKLVLLINGVILFVYIVIFLILLLKG